MYVDCNIKGELILSPSEHETEFSGLGFYSEFFLGFKQMNESLHDMSLTTNSERWIKQFNNKSVFVIWVCKY